MNGRMEAEQMAAGHEARQPVAWAVMGTGDESDHVVGLHDTALDAHFRVGRMVSYGEIRTADQMRVIPLYSHPPLTDAERDAVAWAAFEFDSLRPDNGKAAERAATLRGLLARCATSTREGTEP